MAKLLMLTFDLKKPRAKGDPYKKIEKKLLKIQFKKSVKRDLPANTYVCKIKGEENEDDIKKIRGSYMKKIKNIIKSEHPSDAIIFLIVGEIWASRISAI